MHRIRKKILTDEQSRPVAVQIDYDDWLELERSLNLPASEAKHGELSRYAGSVTLTEDPLAYQTRLRSEWP